MSTLEVVWATCAEVPDGDPDDRLALDALAEAGVDVRFQVWDDPAAGWSAPTVVRSTWDYATRREEFLAWARRVPVLWNPAHVLEWNTDKTYLDELAAAGVPVVPSATLGPQQRARVDAEVAAALEGAGSVVVKPTVSAGSRDTRRHSAADGAVAHVHALLDAGRTVLVQPYLDAVDTAGETGLVVLDGQVSHAFRKGQILHADAAATDGLYAVEDIRASGATPEQAALADRVTRWLADRFPGAAPLLYARVDTVPGPDGRPVLLELELTEPSLWLQARPEATATWAQAVARRLRTLPR
ncbi:ATP-grasp domain-containing protein [Aquipuribacter sp. SD81]|uniref:ATP-grasp domain-containing protein n=1 Tax=Aquipuribacter sp. SD81 TaxID=3127703 RepID=UPI0030173017